MIPAQEVHELLTKIHDILDNAVSKWVGNQLIFLSLSNSASRQHCEVWASQLPFLHNFKDSVPSSEACHYGHINWSLVQAQQQSSLGLPQSAISVRWQDQTKAGFPVTVQMLPVVESRRGSMAKKPCSCPMLEGH